MGVALKVVDRSMVALKRVCNERTIEVFGMHVLAEAL